jgi:hypothetical protein
MVVFLSPWSNGRGGESSGGELQDEETLFARQQAEHADDDYTMRHRFYAPPARLLTWGGKQESRHAAAHDVFVDLILVAACFQTGHFLSHNLERPAVGILGLCAFGATSVSLWSDLLAYRSRFESDPSLDLSLLKSDTAGSWRAHGAGVSVYVHGQKPADDASALFSKDSKKASKAERKAHKREALRARLRARCARPTRAAPSPRRPPPPR